MTVNAQRISHALVQCCLLVINFVISILIESFLFQFLLKFLFFRLAFAYVSNQLNPINLDYYGIVEDRVESNGCCGAPPKATDAIVLDKGKVV